MARGRGRYEGSVRERKPGSWEGRVSRGIDGQGRAIRTSVYGSTKTEVLQKMAELRIAPTPVAGRERMNLGELLDLWLKAMVAEGRLRPASVAYYRSAAVHLKESLGRMPLAKLRGPAIDLALAQIEATPTRASAHTALKVALKFAARRGLIDGNPMSDIRRPKTERGERARIWTPEEAQRVLAEAARTDWLAVYALALGAGLRRGEIFALRWRDVDLARAIVRIERSLSEVAGKFSIQLPKTRSSARTVDLPKLAVTALLARMPEDADPEGLIFEAGEGKPGEPRYVRRSNFDRRIHEGIVKAADVPYRTMHELRHSHASMLLSAGQSLTVVSERLGHADPAMTLRVYSHLLPRAQAAAALAIGDMLTPAKAPKTRKAKR